MNRRIDLKICVDFRQILWNDFPKQLSPIKMNEIILRRAVAIVLIYSLAQPKKKKNDGIACRSSHHTKLFWRRFFWIEFNRLRKINKMVSRCGNSRFMCTARKCSVADLTISGDEEII